MVKAQPSEPASRGTCVFVLQAEGSSLPSLWYEPKDWMNQHPLQEPSSSSHITVQYRAAADTHMVQREQEGEKVARLAQGNQ